MKTPNKNGVTFEHSVFLIANECDCRADHGAEGGEHLKYIAASLREAIAEREGMMHPAEVRLVAICEAIRKSPNFTPRDQTNDELVAEFIKAAKIDYDTVVKLEGICEKLCELVGSKSYDALFEAVSKLKRDLEKQKWANPALGESFDGGPAFPSSIKAELSWDGENRDHLGMSLRDHFAGLAMQALLSLPENRNTYSKDAEESYKTADAMLAERSKKIPAADAPVMWHTIEGALLADREIPGLTHVLFQEDTAKSYGSKFFVAESMTKEAAQSIAKAFGCRFVEKEVAGV